MGEGEAWVGAVCFEVLKSKFEVFHEKTQIWKLPPPKICLDILQDWRDHNKAKHLALVWRRDWMVISFVNFKHLQQVTGTNLSMVSGRSVTTE